LKQVLRSVIDFGDGDNKISQDNLILNLQKLVASHYEWTRPDDQRLYTFVVTFFQQRMEVPSAQTMEDYFERLKDIEAVERLKDVKSVPSYIRTNFDELLKTSLEDQHRIKAVALLKEAQEIITKGLEIEGERKQGVRDGIQHFASKANDLIISDYNARTRGDIRDDGEDIWNEYQQAKVNKDKVWGKFTGLNNIDTNCHGAKKGELWIHAAYPGELKCLAGDVTIFDHRTNRRRTLHELFQSGDLPIVTALDREGETHKLVLAETSHLVENGVRAVHDLRLSSGRQIGATGNHKFFTPSGWKRLDELTLGDWVAVPSARWRHANTTKYRPSAQADTLALFASAPAVRKALEGDLSWEQVVAIDFRGEELTYDLSVPGHHTFVANDIVTHNTSLAMNWCYNLVTRYKANVLYVSLEMPYHQLRRIGYVIHSASAKWQMEGFEKPLDYRMVRDGMLSPKDEAFYQEVIRDFHKNPEYSSFEVWSPDREVDMDDIRLEAELLHKRMEVGMIVLDHGMLVNPRRKKRSKDYVVELNSVIRDAKKLALHFNQGEGIPVLMLFQINRQGKVEADKNEGRYKMSALTYANETDKSADIITTTYLNDEHRRQGTTLLCNLKNRDNPLFEPFPAEVNFSSRRIRNRNSMNTNYGHGMSADIHSDAIQMASII